MDNCPKTTRKQQHHHNQHAPQTTTTTTTASSSAAAAAATNTENHHASASAAVSANQSSSQVNPNDVQQLKEELDREKQHRHQAQCDYADLKRRLDECAAAVAAARENPVSKYDQQIAKQSYFNETLARQIAESKEKLKEMSHSLKHIQACGKECNIHMRDLIVDYHCITKEHLHQVAATADQPHAPQARHSHPHHLHPPPQQPHGPHHHHHLRHYQPHQHRHHHQHHNHNQQHNRRRRRSLDSLFEAPLRRDHCPDAAAAASATLARADAAEKDQCSLVVSRGGANGVEEEENAGPDGENGGELAKEIRRFQRMQIDLKSNLDRLQWRLDCESKIYHSVNDQYQKLQMDLYYLKNLNEKGANREMWMS